MTIKDPNIKFSATVKVVKADLPSYPVDVIVNAANQELKHGGGLALDIVQAGRLFGFQSHTDWIRQSQFNDLYFIPLDTCRLLDSPE